MNQKKKKTVLFCDAKHMENQQKSQVPRQFYKCQILENMYTEHMFYGLSFNQEQGLGFIINFLLLLCCAFTSETGLHHYAA